MRKKLVIAFIAVLMVSVFSMETFAYQGRRGGRNKRKQGMFRVFYNPFIMKKAGISQEKAKKIRVIFLSAKKKNIMLKAAVKVEKINLMIEFKKATVSQEAVLAIVKKISDIKIKIAQNSAIAKVKAINTLTVQEREKLKEFIMEMVMSRRHNRGPGMGMMGRQGRPMMNHSGSNR